MQDNSNNHSEQSASLERTATSKLVYCIPAYIFAYTAITIWLMFDGWVNSFKAIYPIWAWSEDIILPSHIVFLLFTILGAMLGSSLLGIISFHRYIAIEKNFDTDHIWGFVFLPLLACIVGVLIFAIVQSGLFVLSGKLNSPEDLSNATLGYLAIGGIAGYNWDVFIKKLQEMSTNILNTPKETP